METPHDPYKKIEEPTQVQEINFQQTQEQVSKSTITDEELEELYKNDEPYYRGQR